jgi:non-ribosomal peptide synthetase component F
MLIDEAPAAPLPDLLAVGLAAGPDEAAMVSAEERVTWRQLEEASLRLAGARDGHVDEVIAPASTRACVAAALSVLGTGARRRGAGNIPL